jgi:glyoxylate/hydroxypyruvate reductase A
MRSAEAGAPVSNNPAAGVVPGNGLPEQAVFGVLAVHRHLPQYIANQRRQRWEEAAFIPTAKRRLGSVGQGPATDAACRQLEALGFQVSAGDALQCDILLCVSPGELSSDRSSDILEGLAPDASVVIIGETGEALLDALRRSLGSGQVTAAYLALAGGRPLAADDALWSHPHVMVSPLG